MPSIRTWIEERVSSASIRLLMVLVFVDGLFLSIHALHVRYDRPGSGMWLISRDRGFPEIYQYLKEASAAVLLLLAYRLLRAPVQAAWAALFVYLLVDDSLEVHETLGDRLALGDMFGIEGRDVGQVVVSATVGALLLAAIAVATIGERSPARRLTFVLLPVLVGLGLFGVVADVVEPIDVLGLVEDGGEMVMLSVALAIVFEHWNTVRDVASPRPRSLVGGDYAVGR